MLAHQFAMESPFVQAEAISAYDFHELSDQYAVSGVPHTAIIDSEGKLIGTVVGSAPESHLLEEVKKALTQ